MKMRGFSYVDTHCILGRHLQGAKHILICSAARGRGCRDLHRPECKKRSRGRRGEVRAILFCRTVIILRSLFGNFYNKMSHIMPSSSRDQSKRSLTKQMSPALASQLETLWKESQSQTSGFKKPEMQQITKVGIFFKVHQLFHSRQVCHSRGTLKILVTTICRPRTPWSCPRRSSRSLMRRAIEEMLRRSC